MRTVSRLIPMLLIAACAKADKPATEAAAAPPAPPAFSLQDIAGTWSMKTFREGSDSVLLTFQMTATNSESGWSFTFPGREAVPVRVIAVAGDSVITEAGPYESALR